MSNVLHLFSAFGIELEYMVVDKKSLAVRPDADVALRDAAGAVTSDVEDGEITWSNELAAHVIELKTSGPAPTLAGLGRKFHESARKIDRLLAEHGACLMPTAMHPFMNPATDAKLWAHDNSEIYQIYDRIFGCKGHGWSNLQSMHINLPFADDDEFGRLHAAIRFVLPLLPALAASSPYEHGFAPGEMDRRLMHYQQNQKLMPTIAGHVIPEPAWTAAEYEAMILRPMYDEIASHDPDGLLREDWLNSRGAIARFGRKAIEIRVMDVQESTSADIALAKFTCAMVLALSSESISSQATIRAFGSHRLKRIFDVAATRGSSGHLADAAYVTAWGFHGTEPSFRDLFTHILKADWFKQSRISLDDHDQSRIALICERGTLAERLYEKLGARPAHEALLTEYRKIITCFRNDEPYQ